MSIIEQIYNQNKSFVENENFAGVRKIITDNYSDDVHFVYELLQNADDVSATEILFELKKDKLLVTHNGKLFTEKDLKAICSISMGTKGGDYTKIGRFGIGFKSVFVYTDSPQIFSGDYSFEIRDLIMPKVLPAQKSLPKEKTLFIFPFNASKTKEKAYSSICEKLEVLADEALLFLKHISLIKIRISNQDGTLKDTSITKSIISEEKLDNDEVLQRVCVHCYDIDQYYWLLTKNNIELEDTDENGVIRKIKQSIKIAFTEEDGVICPCSDYEYDMYNNYYVFFPTRIQSNCDFLIHAPFITKSSRDTIALNNDANKILKSNLGVLIADSLYVFVKRNMLSLDLIDKLYFCDNKDKEIWDSFTDQLCELIVTGNEIIPCENSTSKSIDEVLFTKEKANTYRSITKLMGKSWISEFFHIPESFEICQVEEYCEFYGFLTSYFDCKELCLQEIVKSLSATFYKDKSSQWVIEFIKLFVIKNSWGGYDVTVDTIDKYPLIRKKDGTHIYPERSYNVFLNNGTLDEEVLSDSTVKYLYEHVYKIKNYSLELGEAKESIKKIKSINIDEHFDEYAELLSKVLIAIDMKRLSSEDLENEPMILVQNQKTGLKKIVSPKSAKLGIWARQNGDFDLYVLLKGVSVDLLDPRYTERFNVRELKQLGCSEGLDYYEVDLYSYLSSLGVKNAWYAKYIRPLPGRANNRQFKPLQQIRFVPEMLAAPMSIEKSIMILRLAKDFDVQIIDWVEWSTRKGFEATASYSGYDNFYSAFGLALHTSAWLYNNKMKLVKPSMVEVDNLAPEYKRFITSDIAEKLGIKKSQTEAIATLMSQLESNGFYAIPLEEREEFEEYKRRKQQKEEEIEELHQKQLDQAQIEPVSNSSLPHDDNEIDNCSEPTNTSIKKDEIPNNTSLSTDFRMHKTGHSVIDSIVEKTVENIDENPSDIDVIEPDFEEEFDDDELIPKAIDYDAQKKKKEKKYAADIKNMQHKDDLQNIAVNAQKYSFLWFKTLLEMESLNSKESNSNRETVSITFTGSPEKEVGKSKTLILKNPDSHIPAFIEDLADMPLYFYDGEKETKVTIDAASVKSYTLRVKLKNVEDLEKIDLSRITSVKLVADSPAFLIEELRKQFNALPYNDDFDMRANLCENINFVFGPPGTGKTTYLANELLIPLMKKAAKCKVLVLAPTNKAADVITRRIIECSGSDITYENWLVRFGSTNEEDIENSSIYYHKDYDIDRCDKSVTITTIDRFPYDFFMPQNKNITMLRNVDWDLIVIDEASMIPIAKIIYPLYLKKPRKFVIAGDPFQIEPIASISLWKDENIYKLVKLDSFANPKTVPHQYVVLKLTTQYRSIPTVGEIFSQFAYNGILHHFRKNKDQKRIIFGDDLAIDTLNIIKFPVSKYESIYRSKQLNRSAYHIYSALFTYEYAMFLAERISRNNSNVDCKIGIIAPYRAEADLIHKLIAAEKIPERIDVQVGTIHGFQGDECDIVIAVFNAPPGMSDSEGMFLNKKTIMNVAISRARDYLFVIMPDNNTEKIENLKLVRKIEQLIKKSSVWKEFNSHYLEKVMFDDMNYLEKNSFATSHQSVNVYGLPENKYEIRAEDTAVDIQVHKATIDSSGNNKAELSIYNVPEDLQKDTDTYAVDGDIRGEYFIAPYEGKLSQYSTNSMNQMFFIITKNGQTKHIPVKVDETNKIIYIFKPNYQREKIEFATSPVLKIKYKL